jgi:serine/threonine protein kinase
VQLGARGAVTLKIGDFGLARPLQEEELAETTCGSPLYAAPEVRKTPS